MTFTPRSEERFTGQALVISEDVCLSVDGPLVVPIRLHGGANRPSLPRHLAADGDRDASGDQSHQVLQLGDALQGEGGERARRGAQHPAPIERAALHVRLRANLHAGLRHRHHPGLVQVQRANERTLCTRGLLVVVISFGTSPSLLHACAAVMTGRH